jgi:hypothetical protein
MGDLIDSLVRVFEFLIQGILAIVVVGFALVWFHPLKRAVFSYANDIRKFMLEGTGGNTPEAADHPELPKLAQELRKIVVPIAFLGLAYFFGILMNVVGYWVLEPVHHLAILDAERAANRATATPIVPSEILSVKPPGFVARACLPFLRFLGGAQDQQAGTAYVIYLREEVNWRNCNLPALSHALDPQLKQFRVVRGAIICSLALFLLALLKGIYFLLIWLFLKSPWASSKPIRWLYDHTVDPATLQEQIEPGGRRKKDPRLLATRKYALGALTLSVLALGLYLMSLAGWQTVEKEYHLMARFGSETCPPAK